ncbi:MAG: 16S rRNA methyltransferase [Ardenticatenaceae bacterium]|nr:16S rRNA methyltransferase [Ardenticatenaceae bacterium]
MADLDELVTAVRAASKYQQISPDLVRRVGAEELAKRPRLKEAVKATKNKLHQIGGAYLTASIDYKAALARIEEGQRRGAQAYRQALLDIMRLHASTRERLDILDTFYATTLAGLPPIHSVLDAACGLNPLARPWMPLDEDAEYRAYDIYGDMMAFLNDYFALAGVPGRAEVRDVAAAPPAEPVDLALLLKTLPVLAQIDKTAVPRLLDTLQARFLLISFPAQSLGGRPKGMVANYEAQFAAWAEGRNWQIKRFEFASELAFLVKND